MANTDIYDYIVRILRITKERKCTYSHVVERSAMARETIKPILFDLIDKGFIQNIVPQYERELDQIGFNKEHLHSPQPIRLLYITGKGHDLLLKLEEILEMTRDKNKKGRKPRKHSPTTNFVTDENYKG